MNPKAAKKVSSAFNCEESLGSLTGFIRSEVGKTGFSKVVVGLSGGIDSSLCAALAVHALGARNVIGVMMPYETSTADSLSDARQLAAGLGIDQRLVEITPMVKPYLERHPGMSPVRRGNVMARMRMIVLYDISAAENSLVLGTGNKTEYLLGYCTLWGDTACAFNPLGDLYKSQVRALAAYLGLPESITAKTPSADLWSGQTDEDELGFSYDEADALLELLIDRGLEPEEVEELGFSSRLIDTILERVERTQFKRRLPPIAKLDHRKTGAERPSPGNKHY
ncbi:MAG: NAD+ synthase [Candidatus Glassbacteria bacterium]|nr:NAD+ synthase [Candidatus Glassbacteria bacterium]